MRYKIIFHSGSYSKVDSECDDYNQAIEIKTELSNQMYAYGERDFYYEIKDTQPKATSDDYLLNDSDFQSLMGR